MPRITVDSIDPINLAAELAAKRETEGLKTDVVILKEKVSSLENQLENKKTWFQFNVTTFISVLALIAAVVTLVKDFV